MALLGLPSPLDVVDATWINQPLVYLVGAAVCLLIALRGLKRALAPVRALIRAAAAAGIAAFAVVLALTLLGVAAVATVQ